jgi:hypothetical protein
MGGTSTLPTTGLCGPRSGELPARRSPCGAGPQPLQGVLLVVQPRALPFRHRLAPSRRRPSWTGRAGPAGPRRGVDRRLHPKPERFVRKHPQPPAIPTTVWINEPPPRKAPPCPRDLLGWAVNDRTWGVLGRRQGVAKRPSKARPAPYRRPRFRVRPGARSRRPPAISEQGRGSGGSAPREHHHESDSLNETPNQPPRKG